MYYESSNIVLTIAYLLFSVCVVYPPAEFIAAGFTIPQLFEEKLGSENVNFVRHHMRRINLTLFIHSLLPSGYFWCLMIRGVNCPLMSFIALLTIMIPSIVGMKIVNWVVYNKSQHPVVKALLPYVADGVSWRALAYNLNAEFRNVDKVTTSLTTTSKLVVTETWILKVTQYGFHAVKQSDCDLVATSTDIHTLTPAGEDQVQYLSVEIIPTRVDVEKFSFRVSTTALTEIQHKLDKPVIIPQHLTLLPSLIDRFIEEFKQRVDQNPVFYVDEELEACIGCMVNISDVKLDRLCLLEVREDSSQRSNCQQCNCRVAWCVSCMARWWSARAPSPPSAWLSAPASCPICRSKVCIKDVRPVRRR